MTVVRHAIAVALALPLAGAGAPLPSRAVLAAASCATLERDAARRIVQERDRQMAVIEAGGDAAAAEESSTPSLQLEPVFRACWQERVRPALVRAQSDDAALDAAVSDFFGWSRATLLLGLETQFAAEERDGTTLVRGALRNAYERARQRCHRRRDVAAVRQLLGIARFAALIGESDDFFATLDADVRACTQGTWYHVTNRTRFLTGRHGATWDVTYDAWLGQKPGGEPGELTGVGTYRGAIKGALGGWRVAEACYTQMQVYPVGGRLEAKGRVAPVGDGSFLTTTITSTDWQYAALGPLAGGKFVALVGMPDDTVDVRRSAGIMEMLTLTGPVTRDRVERPHGSHQCTGAMQYLSETTVREVR